MSVKNYYPEKPEVKYQRTQVEMGAIVAYLQSLHAPAEVKRTAYIMFRNEGANGRAGVNNNYIGAQADGARWPAKWDNRIVGTLVKRDSGGQLRRFVAFHSWEDSIDMLIDRVQSRGLYIGGHPTRYAHIDPQTPEELCLVYYREWVTGDETYLPTEKQTKDFLSMYRQAQKIFV